jgi:hypothetical protein
VPLNILIMKKISFISISGIASSLALFLTELSAGESLNWAFGDLPTAAGIPANFLQNTRAERSNNYNRFLSHCQNEENPMGTVWFKPINAGETLDLPEAPIPQPGGKKPIHLHTWKSYRGYLSLPKPIREWLHRLGVVAETPTEDGGKQIIFSRGLSTTYRIHSLRVLPKASGKSRNFVWYCSGPAPMKPAFQAAIKVQSLSSRASIRFETPADQKENTACRSASFPNGFFLRTIPRYFSGNLPTATDTWWKMSIEGKVDIRHFAFFVLLVPPQGPIEVLVEIFSSPPEEFYPDIQKKHHSDQQSLISTTFDAALEPYMVSEKILEPFCTKPASKRRHVKPSYLHHMIQANRIADLQALIEGGIDVSAPIKLDTETLEVLDKNPPIDALETTVLHAAIVSGKLEILELLLGIPAIRDHINSPDGNRHRPLDLAQCRDKGMPDRPIIRLLKQYGAQK